VIRWSFIVSSNVATAQAVEAVVRLPTAGNLMIEGQTPEKLSSECLFKIKGGPHRGGWSRHLSWAPH
jgi:hypothetical protein